MSAPDTQIVNAERAYFTMLPNIVDDLGLSVHAFRLYCHIRRVAGEAGACWQSTSTLAKACKMSAGAVSKAKKELQEAGLITIQAKLGEHGEYHEVTLVDIWPRNMNHFAMSGKQDAESEKQDTEQGERSPHERKRSPGETKKNPLRRTTIDNRKKPGYPTTNAFGKNARRRKRVTRKDSPPPSLLTDKLFLEVQKLGIEPDREACQKAIVMWSEEVEKAKEDGRDWKVTNMHALLERYDIKTLSLDARIGRQY